MTLTCQNSDNRNSPKGNPWRFTKFASIYIYIRIYIYIYMYIYICIYICI